MKITINGNTYTGATAVALIDNIKGLRFDSAEIKDAEDYIIVQADTYRRMAEKEMELPKGDTETRAIAMFKAIHGLGAWRFDMEG